MGGNFKHYAIEMSHRHYPLLVMQTLVAVSNTMANSFALIYLYKTGEDYLECALFVLICVAVPTVLIAFASRPLVRNFAESIETSLMFLAAYYVSLMFLDGWALVLVPPVLFGVYMAAFWVPYNALVMHITSRKKRGAIVGVYFLIFPMVSTTAPLIGGILIGAWSYQLLFAVAAAVSIANLVFVAGLRVFANLRDRIIVPELLQSLKIHLVGRVHIDLDLKGVDWRIKSALFAEGIQDGIFWILVPLITFEFAKSEMVLSGYLALFAFWGAVMTVVLGYLSDRLKDRAHIVRIGAAFGALSVMFASHAASGEQYLSAMSVAFFWIAMIPSFLFTMLVDKLERFKRKGVLIREFYLNGGRCAGVAVVALVLLAGASLNIALTVSAVALAAITLVK